jgi:hypothetical protein
MSAPSRRDDRGGALRRSSRREVLVAAAALALARPAAAGAAEDDAQTLLRLLAREDAAAAAYERSRPEPLPGVAAAEADHAKALRTQLEALGWTDVAPLDAPARRPTEAADDARLDAAIALEETLVDDYLAALPGLTAPGILRTAATILASHSQHLARLRSAAGRDPFA